MNRLQNNAFTAGIDPGGLTNDYEIKILVCYILEKIKRHMTFSEINYILQSEGLANYFEYAEAISELLSSGHIVDISQGEGEQRFRLSDLGVKTARTFEKNIPLSVREKSMRAAEEYYLRQRIEKENQVKIEKVSDGYRLSLCISDIGSDLLNLSLFVPTEKECEQIKKRFLCDPTIFYRGIIALVTGDEHTVNTILQETLEE